MVVLTEQIVRGKTRMDKLEEVKNLNLWGQDIDDVSVLARLPGVEVLSLSVNRIASLRDFRHCQLLRELYLRKNYITDIADLQYLVPLSELRVLWLCDNPCADHPWYRQLVAHLLPGVDKLDNQEITPQDRDAAKRNPELVRYAASFTTTSPQERPASRTPTPVQAPSPSPQAHGPSSTNGLGSRPDSRVLPDGIPGRSPSQGLGAGDFPGRRRKNVLYAVMALVSELDEDDLVYVKREIEQRLGALGR